MAFFVEESKDFSTYKAQGFFSFQDIQALVKNFDIAIATNPQAKFLMDFTGQTGYEEANIKYVFDRIDKGIPSSVRMALLYEKEGLPFHVLQLIAKAMPQNAHFFANRDDALKWLKS